MSYYVKYTEDLLGLVVRVGTPTGKTRISESGKIEAELICLDREADQYTTWVTRDQLCQ